MSLFVYLENMIEICFILLLNILHLIYRPSGLSLCQALVYSRICLISFSQQAEMVDLIPIYRKTE